MAIVAGLSILAGTLTAQQSTPQPRKGPAERSLLGISLFDPGTKVIAKYGNPDDIQALTIGGGGAAAGGGAGGPAGPGAAPGGRGGPSFGAPGGGRGGGPAAGSPMAAESARGDEALPGFFGDPFGTQLRQRPGAGGPPGGFRPPTGPPGGIPGVPPQGRGGGAASPDEGLGGGPGGRGAAPGGAGMGAGAGASDRVTVTRWVYNRGMARYAFILDKFNRVVQIEAVGMNDSRVKTAKGVKFGSSFGSIIRTYKAPDGYEISGTNIVMRYLVMDRVAFRLQKVDPKKPHVVTGIVVAAGKT